VEDKLSRSNKLHNFGLGLVSWHRHCDSRDTSTTCGSTGNTAFILHYFTVWLVCWCCFCSLIHGIITKEECNMALMNQELGTFMIRFSETYPGLFAVAYVSDDPYERVKHYLVKPGTTFWDFLSFFLSFLPSFLTRLLCRGYWLTKDFTRLPAREATIPMPLSIRTSHG